MKKQNANTKLQLDISYKNVMILTPSLCCCCWSADNQCRLILSSRPSNAASYCLSDVSWTLLDRVLGVRVSPFRSRLLYVNRQRQKTSWPDSYIVTVSRWLECCASSVCDVNPLKPSVIMWLHFECSAPYRPNLPFLISDIRALWVSPERQSARMSEIKNGRLGLYGKV